MNRVNTCSFFIVMIKFLMRLWLGHSAGGSFLYVTRYELCDLYSIPEMFYNKCINVSVL